MDTRGKDSTGTPYSIGRLCTIDLLVLHSLGQLILKLKILFTLVTKQAALMRRSTVLCLALQWNSML
jgi:hypothetical protein